MRSVESSLIVAGVKNIVKIRPCLCLTHLVPICIEAMLSICFSSCFGSPLLALTIAFYLFEGLEIIMSNLPYIAIVFLWLMVLQPIPALLSCSLIGPLFIVHLLFCTSLVLVPTLLLNSLSKLPLLQWEISHRLPRFCRAWIALIIVALPYASRLRHTILVDDKCKEFYYYYMLQE